MRTLGALFAVFPTPAVDRLLQSELARQRVSSVVGRSRRCQKYTRSTRSRFGFHRLQQYPNSVARYLRRFQFIHAVTWNTDQRGSVHIQKRKSVFMLYQTPITMGRPSMALPLRGWSPVTFLNWDCIRGDRRTLPIGECPVLPMQHGSHNRLIGMFQCGVLVKCDA